MMEQVVFKAQKRDIRGKQVRAIRRDGKLPAILYGHHITSQPIYLDLREVSRVLPTITRSQLITIDVEGEKHTTLVRERQRHPVQGTLLHVDFMAISMTEKLKTTVHIEFVGDAPAVKEFSGLIVTGIENVEVTCLPTDLPEKITVSLSVLAKIGDSLHVRDLAIPEGVEILTSGDEMLVLVTSPAGEEIEEVVAVEAEAEPEVIERGKKEAEEEGE